MKDVHKPHHRNPSKRRTATAAYNFIPLPSQIVPAEPLPTHNTFDPERKSGYFNVSMQVETPLYIRGTLTRQKFGYLESGKDVDGNFLPQDRNPEFKRLVQNIPDFFSIDGGDTPRIPGSSLRGMIRTLIEILAYGKLQPVTHNQFFFRTVDDSSIGVYYRNRMNNESIRAGFLRRDKEGYYIVPTQYAKIWRYKNDNPNRKKVAQDTFLKAESLYKKNGNTIVPKWKGGFPHQHAQIWVQLSSNGEKVERWRNTKPESDGDWAEGRLMITGDMPIKDVKKRKKREFVILLPTSDEKIRVSEEMIDRFHDEDQLTQYQQKAFPKNEPFNNARRNDGMLVDQPKAFEEPIFYLLEPDENGKMQLTFFGRTRMFRLPYKHRPLDLIGADLKDSSTVDMAEAIFGFVRDSKQDTQSVAGRVYFTDAQLTDDGKGDLFEPEQTPQIQSTPKPTSFQHYLTQNIDHKKDLHHYDTTSIPECKQIRPTLRGHKLYWHQPQAKRTIPESEVNEDLQSTQLTRIKPVKKGVKFQFSVHFENLTEAELGALAWALKPTKIGTHSLVHHLGMAKNAGYGSVALIKASVHIAQLKERYENLFTNSGFANPFIQGDMEDYKRKFEKYILDHLGLIVPYVELERIRSVLQMLAFEDSNRPFAETMSIKGRGKIFQHRLILPTPFRPNGEDRSSDESKFAPWQKQQDKLVKQEKEDTKQVSPQPKAEPTQPYYEKKFDEPLPEVREDVNDFANLFMQKMQEKGKQNSSKKKRKR